MSMPSSQSTFAMSFGLADPLSRNLPVGLDVNVYELASVPTKCSPIFLPPPGKAPRSTTRESRFFAVEHDSVLVFAMEILVYKDGDSGDTTVFVSKADSSGYFPHKLSSFASKADPRRKLSVFRSVASAILDYVVDIHQQDAPKSRITIALFARSQTQYLFANSAANKAKHVLCDRSLIAWWCKTIDPTYQRYAKSATAKAYLLVPGSDRIEVQKLFPEIPSDGAGWAHGHPFQLDPDRDITIREAIPHFPDDPKSRFMEELNGEDSEKSSKRGHKWASIQTFDQFWELMSYRQECSAGRCVGFLWICITNGEDAQTGAGLETGHEKPVADSEDQGPPSSQEQTNASGAASLARPKMGSRKRSVSNANPLLSPRKKSRTFNGPIHTRQNPYFGTALVVDDRQYKRAFESLLLHSDFGSIEKARKSSRKWIDGAYAMSHGPNTTDGEAPAGWGQPVKGGMEVVALDTVDAQPGIQGHEDDKKPQVNMLGAGLIRKKKKST